MIRYYYEIYLDKNLDKNHYLYIKSNKYEKFIIFVTY